MNMSEKQIAEEIKEANLSYLLLAQQMIRADRISAIFRLGLSADLVDLIDGLSPAQLLRMAASDTLLCGFRFDENLLMNVITDYNKDRLMSQAHTAILMSGRAVAQLAA